MGNAVAKDDDDPSGRANSRFPGNGDAAVRRGSDDIAKNCFSLPVTPGRSRSPPSIGHEVPPPPLQRTTEVSLDFDVWKSSLQGPIDVPPDKGIPTFINWSYGGNEVLVEGSWDNWKSRKTLQKSGKDFTILIVLPSGIYHYRFIVDGERRFIPDLPNVSDQVGNSVNVLDVTDYVPENLDGVVGFEAPSSPDSSYDREFPVDEDLAKDPPFVPQQLHASAPGDESDEEGSVKPRHVVLNHLFIEKGWAPQSLLALGLTHRFQSKYVTVVLYKPLQKPFKR